MPVQTTTPTLILADFATVLKQLVPTTMPSRDALWREVESIDDVPGPEIRRFFLDLEPGAPVRGGIYGDGVERTFILVVYTSYGGLPPKVASPLIEQDATDLHVAFTRRQSNQLPGLIHVEPSEWIDGPDGGDEAGYRYGVHPFEIRYLAPGSI